MTHVGPNVACVDRPESVLVSGKADINLRQSIARLVHRPGDPEDIVCAFESRAAQDALLFRY